MKVNVLSILKLLNPLLIIFMLSTSSFFVFGDLRLPIFVFLGARHGFIWIFSYPNDYVFVFALLLIFSVLFIVFGLWRKGFSMYLMNAFGWALLYLIGVIGLGFGI